MSNYSQAQSERRDDGNLERQESPKRMQYSHEPVSRSNEQERRKAAVGGVMSYGDINYGVISDDKMTDIAQL